MRAGASFKRRCCSLTLAGYVGLVLVCGCGGDSAPEATVDVTAPLPSDPVDLTALNKTFQNADAGLKLYVEESVALIRTRAWTDASEQMKKLANNPNLTTEQKAAVTDLIGKLETLARGGR